MSEQLEQLQDEFETYKTVVNWLLGLVISKGLITRQEAAVTLGVLMDKDNFDSSKLDLGELKNWI